MLGIGVDIGGTSIKLGLVNKDGKILDKIVFDTPKDFYQLFYKRAVGTDLERDHYIVNLWENEGENVYKARKIRQTVSITEATGGAGEQKQISGTLRGGDFEYGTFNISTNEFTADV